MKYVLSIFIYFALSINVTFADSINIAHNLGIVIGSEKYCDLSFNQQAIRELIEKKVSANDMDFPNDLHGSILTTELYNKDRSLSAKTAHCVQVKRIAESYGLIK